MSEPKRDSPQDVGWEDEAGVGPRLVLDIDGFEGPIDLLLTLSRDQKVDLARISILQLADQYLDFIARARELRLEIAADYLVMAAWLAYLKSRLLLPVEEQEEQEPTAEEMAEALAFQLRRLEAMQEAAARLLGRPKLGEEVFARGAPERVPVTATVRYDVSLFELLRAYAHHRQRRRASNLMIEPSRLYPVEAALERLERLLGRAPDWRTLASCPPPNLRDSLVTRSALASTLAATLELAKAGRLRLRQENAFGPIYLRPSSPDERRD